ncbi:unnamed protein product [Ixodes pacificus]
MVCVAVRKRYGLYDKRAWNLQAGVLRQQMQKDKDTHSESLPVRILRGLFNLASTLDSTQPGVAFVLIWLREKVLSTARRVITLAHEAVHGFLYTGNWSEGQSKIFIMTSK